MDVLLDDMKRDNDVTQIYRQSSRYVNTIKGKRDNDVLLLIQEIVLKSIIVYSVMLETILLPRLL